MQKGPLIESSSSFQLESGKTILNFQEIKPSDIEITSKRTYTQTVLFHNYILFFGDKLCTQTDILAFDIELMKWITIPVDAKKSKAFLEDSDCRICCSPYFVAIFFHGVYKNAHKYQSFFEYLDMAKQNDKEANSQNQLPFKMKLNDLALANIPFRRYQTSDFIEGRMYLFGGIDEINTNRFPQTLDLLIIDFSTFFFLSN